MKVLVTGSSGFIGSRFIDLHEDEFEEIIKLNSNNAPLKDYQKLSDLSQGVDVIVHTAFDHNYKHNIVGIKNILQVCRENNIKKLIYLSTVSVYDLDTEGTLNENSPYSKLNDPYSKEKRKIEKVIDDFDRTFDVVVLQPSIVYGLGGNWTKYVLHVCKSKKVLLPNSGNSIANIIYVDDLAEAIKRGIKSNIKYEKILISNETMNWKEFYCKQCDILDDLGLPSNCDIEKDGNINEFHSNTAINFIFTLWFRTPFGNLFDMMIGALKKIRARSYENTSSEEMLKRFLYKKRSQDILVPSGITKKVHNSRFEIDTSKAKKLLNFYSKNPFDKSCDMIKNNIEKILK